MRKLANAARILQQAVFISIIVFPDRGDPSSDQLLDEAAVNRGDISVGNPA